VTLKPTELRELKALVRQLQQAVLRNTARPQCEHCYCTFDRHYSTTDGIPPHYVCCKCGDRKAAHSNLCSIVTGVD
jgi:hypothetical protein